MNNEERDEYIPGESSLQCFSYSSVHRDHPIPISDIIVITLIYTFIFFIIRAVISCQINSKNNPLICAHVLIGGFSMNKEAVFQGGNRGTAQFPCRSASISFTNFTGLKGFV